MKKKRNRFLKDRKIAMNYDDDDNYDGHDEIDWKQKFISFLISDLLSYDDGDLKRVLQRFFFVYL